jgi:hypothetical protein
VTTEHGVGTPDTVAVLCPNHNKLYETTVQKPKNNSRVHTYLLLNVKQGAGVCVGRNGIEIDGDIKYPWPHGPIAALQAANAYNMHAA